MSKRPTLPPDVDSVTIEHQAFPGILSASDRMFAVQAGTSAMDALEQATMVIDLALRESVAMANETDNSRCWTTSYMLEMAYALSVAALKGLGEAEQ